MFGNCQDMPLYFQPTGCKSTLRCPPAPYYPPPNCQPGLLGHGCWEEVGEELHHPTPSLALPPHLTAAWELAAGAGSDTNGHIFLSSLSSTASLGEGRC